MAIMAPLAGAREAVLHVARARNLNELPHIAEPPGAFTGARTGYG